MKIEEILDLPSAPLAGPSYPKGPYRFVARECMVLTCETHAELIREQLPEPLQPIDPTDLQYLDGT